jgi:hypothetical protein
MNKNLLKDSSESLNIVVLNVSDITAKLEKNVIELKDELNSK